jgi:polar amino acid transport system substrate-binding protein
VRRAVLLLGLALLLGGRALRAPVLEAANRIAAATGAKVLAEAFPTRLERGAGVPRAEPLPYLTEMATETLAGLAHLVVCGTQAPVAFFAYPGRPSRLADPATAVEVLAGPREDAPVALEALADALGAADDAPGADLAQPALPDGPLDAVAIGAAIAAGRVYGGRVTRALLAGYVEIVRGTPVLLQLFVLYYGLSGVVRLPALLAAILGLGLNYAAYESEIYRAALEAIPRAQLEAARTLGLSEAQALRLVRGPQALRLALAPMTNDFVALLKDSSLVSVITVVELTKQTAIYATNVGSWVVPGILCALAYLALSLPLARLARQLERRWSHAHA